MELVAPISIRQSQRNSSASRSRYTLALQQMKISKTEIDGRPRVIPDGKKIKTIEVENIFVAIGAEADSLWHFPDGGHIRTIDHSHCKLIEEKIPIILGGDLTSPVKSVADAIASGKQAAIAIDAYLNKGLEAVDPALAACRVGSGPALSMDAYLAGNYQGRNPHVVAYDEIVTDYFATAPRVVPSTLEPRRRRRSFAEIEATLTDNGATEEAGRCFNCGSCNACDVCRLFCPEMAVEVDKGKRSINMEYCKGCGVCVVECPRSAMALEEEIK
jgi:Pyruvate/2-oxoacid:ferredoxin oxidoreductase delta subunit